MHFRDFLLFLHISSYKIKGIIGEILENPIFSYSAILLPVTSLRKQKRKNNGISAPGEAVVFLPKRENPEQVFPRQEKPKQGNPVESSTYRIKYRNIKYVRIKSYPIILPGKMDVMQKWRTAVYEPKQRVEANLDVLFGE